MRHTFTQKKVGTMFLVEILIKKLFIEISHSSWTIWETNSSLSEIWHSSCKFWGRNFFTNVRFDILHRQFEKKTLHWMRFDIHCSCKIWGSKFFTKWDLTFFMKFFGKQTLHWVRFGILHSNFEEANSSLSDIWQSSQTIWETSPSPSEIWHCSWKIRV
jgi:hypothetical protein